MNDSEARKKAAEYLAANPLENPDYSWVLSDSVDVGDSWYFDYSYEHNSDLPQDQWDAFGGAPGFFIDKVNGAIRDVSWEEHSDRGL